MLKSKYSKQPTQAAGLSPGVADIFWVVLWRNYEWIVLLPYFQLLVTGTASLLGQEQVGFADDTCTQKIPISECAEHELHQEETKQGLRFWKVRCPLGWVWWLGTILRLREQHSQSVTDGLLPSHSGTGMFSKWPVMSDSNSRSFLLTLHSYLTLVS